MSSKIKTIEELAEIASQPSAGRIVLSHGVFDILHPGHGRHFATARKEGDRLWVTITADQFVNKGPGHPHYPQHIRAEQVARLEDVEFVAIHNGPAAPIDLIKPQIYAKGKEYEKPEDDLTGKIIAEREAIERHGGRIVFTDEIVFSSSEIINRYLDVYEPPLRDLLKQYRAENANAKIMDLIAKIGGMKVVLVGETIIDKYVNSQPLGKAAKENIIVVRDTGEEIFAGGVIAAANHVAGLVREVEIVTAIGTEDYDEILELVKKSLLPNVKLRFTLRENQPTTRKTRFVDESYTRKLFEVYRDGPPQYDEKTQKYICKDIEKALEGAADALIVLDYGHGLFMPEVQETCHALAGFLAINTQTNAGNHGFNLITKYEGANYICLDAPEARLARHNRTENLTFAIEELARTMGCTKMIVTTGADGCITFSEDDPQTVSVPAFSGRPIDTMGTGDAFHAVTSACVAKMKAVKGIRMEHIGLIGNAVGFLKMGVVGHRKPVCKVDLIRTLSTVLK